MVEADVNMSTEMRLCAEMVWVAQLGIIWAEIPEMKQNGSQTLTGFKGGFLYDTPPKKRTVTYHSFSSIVLYCIYLSILFGSYRSCSANQPVPLAADIKSPMASQRQVPLLVDLPTLHAVLRRRCCRANWHA